MAHDHPFRHLFESLDRPPVAHAEQVNRRAYEEMADVLTVPTESPGRCILLRATRAGHGKTHLLSRLRYFLNASHEFIPLHPAAGCRIDAASVIDDTLRCLLRALPASGGLCILDLVTRRLFASALQPLVSSGEVPCQDREGALAALRMKPVETFDFHHPTAVTAHWAKEHFDILGQRLSQELAPRCDQPVRGVAFWVDAFFHFASAPPEQAGRGTVLLETVRRGGEGEMERLQALLALVGLLMRVVLVADDVEGFSADETAALRFAAFLGTLREAVPRLDVILAINRDVWGSAFLPRLSDGLADRLSEVVVELEPLNREEMLALLESRTPGLGAQVLARIDLNAAGTHARGLIREAGIVWQRATAAGQKNHSPTVETGAAVPAPRSSPPPPPVSSSLGGVAAGWPGYFPPPPPVAIVPAPAAESARTEEVGRISPASQETEKVVLKSPPEFEAVLPHTPQKRSPESARQVVEESPPPSSAEHPAKLTNDVVLPQPEPDSQAAEKESTEAAEKESTEVAEKESTEVAEKESTEVAGKELVEAVPASGASIPSTESGTDRVDDLLRQFRERYGRGSL